MNEGLKKYHQFLKWFLAFIIIETVLLTVSLNKDFFLSKILINYLFILAIVPFIHEKIKYGKIDLFSPLAIFSSFYLLLFGFRAVDLLIFRPEDFRADEKFYIYSLSYAIIGLHFFQLGYFSTCCRFLIKNRTDIKVAWSSHKLKLIFILYTMVSLISFLIIVKLAGGFSFYFKNIHASMIKITTGSAFFFMAVLLIEIPLLIWYCNVLESRKNALTFVLYLALVLSLFFLLGERGHVLALIISLVAVYNYSKRKLNWKLLLPISVAFLLFLSLYGQYREFSKYNNSIKRLGFNAKIGLETVYHSVMSDFDQLIRLKDIIKYTPEQIDFQLGKTFLNLFLKPIPSRIWEEKPQGAGVIVTKNLYPKHFEAKVSIAPSLVGEFYLNFHIIGIILGMCLFGMVSRLFFELLQHNKGNKNVMLLYAILLPFIYSELRGDFAVVTSFLIFKLFFLFLALHLITEKRRLSTVIGK